MLSARFLEFILFGLISLYSGCSRPETGPKIVPHLLPGNYLHTNGSQIVDSAGHPVRICSVGWGWYGGSPWGLNEFHYKPAFQALAVNGINCVRICTDDAQILNDSEIKVDSSLNPDLAGLKYNQALQEVVRYGASIGLKFIIESHLNENNSQFPSNGNGLWYDLGGASDGTDGNGQTGTVTSDGFLQAWQIRANLFKGNEAVIGYDLRNEPHYGPATWGDGNTDTDYRLMYERVGNAIQDIDPGPLIVCEGLQAYGNGAPSGDLRQSTIGQAMVILSVPDKVVYSVHEYPTEVSETGMNSGPDYVSYMNRVWGWLYVQHIAPVWVGECGDNMRTTAGQQWADTFVSYVNGQSGNQGGPEFKGNEQGISWSWWDFYPVQTNQVPDFGILNSASDGVDLQQQKYWEQMLGH